MNNVVDLNNLFKDKKLLSTALTHKSWVNEHPGQRESNERLEFLGDAILEFIVSHKLFKEFPNKEEGYLTNLRANLVNTKNLSELAKKLNVGDAFFLSKGEEEGGGRTNPSLLADTVEAIIGALFIDQGLDKTIEFIEKNLLSQIPEKTSQPLKDAKSRLQELVQAQGLLAPKYRVVEEIGPDHNKIFTVEVLVKAKSLAKGIGKNKNEAEQKAAEVALKVVNLENSR